LTLKFSLLVAKPDAAYFSKKPVAKKQAAAGIAAKRKIFNRLAFKSPYRNTVATL